MTIAFGYDKTSNFYLDVCNFTGAVLGCDFLQHFNIALDLGKRELIFQSDSKPNIASLDVKDVESCDREIGLSNSKSMSANSFESQMKPVHHDGRDSLHEKQDGDFSHQ